MMNNTYFKHLSVTGVAGGTRPRGSLTLIHDSQPQAKRQGVPGCRSLLASLDRLLNRNSWNQDAADGIWIGEGVVSDCRGGDLAKGAKDPVL
jgi:hypothetical protein